MDIPKLSILPRCEDEYSGIMKRSALTPLNKDMNKNVKPLSKIYDENLDCESSIGNITTVKKEAAFKINNSIGNIIHFN